ncbi:far-red-elongated hypocotyl1-like [Striga asiatica]|uniref:Far-red-elongated hypocotyl1-like n=1 Tax=Striga asiatica TaxID=4170 RepID=A0A5A7R9V9_STRAF|nr:far-red-elongated hypocotyl1-like [Striga asiatica]
MYKAQLLTKVREQTRTGSLLLGPLSLYSSLMEENTIGPDEMNSVAYLSKKRKIQAELLEMPLAKHVCWNNQAKSNTFSSRGEVIFEKVNVANSPDTAMSYAESSSSTPVGNLEGNPFEINSNGPVISYSQIESVRKDLHQLYRDYGLNLSDIYEDYLLEFENHNAYYNSSEDHETVKDVDEVHDYAVSPESQLVNQDARQGSKPKTIDQEFEEYFSMLMM